MMKFSYILGVLLLFGAINNAYADRRYFARSYLAYTLPEGGFEFELWNTGRIGKYQGYYYRFQPRFEFEYGVTDRLSSSFYFNFNQVTSENNPFGSSPLKYSSSSLEFRYRLTNPNEFVVDPALYFEFGYGGDEIEYESKIILSKRFGDFIGVVNLNSEIEREVIESENESVFEVTAGLMYEFSANFAAGLEFRQHNEFEEIYGEQEAQAAFLGPTINFQTESFYITFNFLPQISGSAEVAGVSVSKDNLDLIAHERYEFRTIIGIEL